ncbi:MAG: hypothetical protein ACO1PN_05950 [Betaproteobacteria bacterium]
MKGAEVYSVLQVKRIHQLYHANSITTSATFLRLGGLASREHVEHHGLAQTSQYTDEIDQRFGIWNDVFTDSVDIHARIKNRNQYGPVLFILDTKILTTLPVDIDVLITKSNPTKWANGQEHPDRYFTTPAELAAGLIKGTFDQMITYRIPNGLLPFGAHLQQIILDDPKVNRPDNIGNYAITQQALQEAAAIGEVATPISQRTCEAECKCCQFYAANPKWVQQFFSVA